MQRSLELSIESLEALVRILQDYIQCLAFIEVKGSRFESSGLQLF